jgi:hypothetical protein
MGIEESFYGVKLLVCENSYLLNVEVNNAVNYTYIPNPLRTYMI